MWGTLEAPFGSGFYPSGSTHARAHARKNARTQKRACARACLRACTHAHAYAQRHAAHTRPPTRTHTRVRPHTQACTHVLALAHAPTRPCAQLHTQALARTSVCTHMCAHAPLQTMNSDGQVIAALTLPRSTKTVWQQSVSLQVLREKLFQSGQLRTPSGTCTTHGQTILTTQHASLEP